MATRKKAEQLTETQIVETVDEKIEEEKVEETNTTITTGYKINSESNDLGNYYDKINAPTNAESILSTSAYFNLEDKGFKTNTTTRSNLNYFRYNSGLLSGHWGTQLVSEISKNQLYNVSFIDKIDCAYPKRYSYQSYDKKLTSTSGTYGLHYIDPYIWLDGTKISKGPIIYIELQGGGAGGRNNAYMNWGFPFTIYELGGGGGGGSGGYVNLAIDMRIVNSMSIKIGSGGSGDNSGGSTYVSTSNGFNLYANGGNPASGGGYSADLNGVSIINTLVSNPTAYAGYGILNVQFISGVSGGGGGYIDWLVNKGHTVSYGNSGGSISATINNFGILKSNLSIYQSGYGGNGNSGIYFAAFGGGGGAGVLSSIGYYGSGGGGQPSYADNDLVGAWYTDSATSGSDGVALLHYNPVE